MYDADLPWKSVCAGLSRCACTCTGLDTFRQTEITAMVSLSFHHNAFTTKMSEWQKEIKEKIGISLTLARIVVFQHKVVGIYLMLQVVEKDTEDRRYLSNSLICCLPPHCLSKPWWVLFLQPGLVFLLEVCRYPVSNPFVRSLPEINRLKEMSNLSHWYFLHLHPASCRTFLCSDIHSHFLIIILYIIWYLKNSFRFQVEVKSLILSEALVDIIVHLSVRLIYQVDIIVHLSHEMGYRCQSHLMVLASEMATAKSGKLYCQQF